MIKSVIKRDGRVVLYDQSKITAAIMKALEAAQEGDAAEADRIAARAARQLEMDCGEESPQIEQIQDAVEENLIAADYAKTACFGHGCCQIMFCYPGHAALNNRIFNS